MIIIGTYPDQIKNKSSTSRLEILSDYLFKILPIDIGLHILPFYPSAGDFGFAPNNWYEIREDLGTWKDLNEVSNNWKLIIDGIYNHVGLNHKWVCDFLRNGANSDFFYVFSSNEQSDGPYSPRGQNEYVLRKLSNGNLLWQTFTEVSVDINLHNKNVQKEIKKHIEFLKTKGVWGIRLDAIAYFSKCLGDQIRHVDGVYSLANYIVNIIERYDLNVLAQLDCDEDGIKYFKERLGRNSIPINDFSYPSFFMLSMMDNSPKKLVEHIEETDKAEKIVIRIPRTHDGILLRSKYYTQNDIDRILEFAKVNNIEVRYNNNTPYELNCSAPFLYKKISQKVNFYDTILFSVAVTGMFSGWAYFYFPAILGYIPEFDKGHLKDKDPRALNRSKIDSDFLDEFINSGRRDIINNLLENLKVIHNQQNKYFKSYSCVENSLLITTTIDEKYRLLANFSSHKAIELNPEYLDGESLCNHRFSKTTLDCLGYIILKLK